MQECPGALTMSRVFSWIYLLDSAFVIFNNLPPRMVIKEMRLHMATPEACFQALTADQCHHQIQLSLPARSPYWSISFRGAFESLCKDDPSANIHRLLATLCPLNLFALTSGMLHCSAKIDLSDNHIQPSTLKYSSSAT